MYMFTGPPSQRRPPPWPPSDNHTDKQTNKEQAESVGTKLANVLIETGAKQILDEITIDRERRIKEAQKKGEQVD